ncbi:enoyl-CoA hydratase/isomerase family protein [Histidinibacterium aquaticum]|uniref:Enoyl-CoA hydratase/isomerase family protein n=1 Tax=Histidinibacterium aquaticum TaxID=2613962 RepID=A0A5J5GBT5_9RHOB|nr:enoyl-CoA hydratase/isomerase family protein [Histidinibacterium aquaticum]KAA9005619.1 hypothetical protein F3S47_17085 [Histidinibacterium aquaticum]
MNDTVKYRVRERVAIVTLAAPPTNPLTPEMRRRLWEVFGQLTADERVHAAIIVAEGEGFSAGPDIREGGDGPGAPTLGELCRRIEDCPKPVVAAIHGHALGGGAALALAAHYRLAEPDARIGFPEVHLGLVAGGGVTQRLPRLVGAEAAISMLLSGRPLTAEAARSAGLIDGVVVGHLPTGTHTFAGSLIEGGKPPRPVRARRDAMSDGIAYSDAVAEARAALGSPPTRAPGLIVDCIEAAQLLPFDAGLAFEQAAREESRADPHAAALAHMFRAERRISARLLTSIEGRRTIAEPEGAEIVGRLRHVMGQAVSTLTQAGTPTAQIDRAMVDYGFAATAFGGGEGGAGPEGAQIMRKILAVLMAEGARLVETGRVDRAADVDVLAVYGLEFPRHKGGPMHGAQAMGLLKLKREMTGWAAESSLWEVPRLLEEAVKYAGGFDEARLTERALA